MYRLERFETKLIEDGTVAIWLFAFGDSEPTKLFFTGVDAVTLGDALSRSGQMANEYLAGTFQPFDKVEE